MSTLNRPDEVREQYLDSSNLNARIALHRRFSTNRYGFGRWLFDRLDIGPDARVLEVGCGPGGLWNQAIDRVPAGWCVIATDVSLGMTEEAKTTIDDERFTFAVTDAQALPLVSASFDAVVANHMLYHVPDVHRALAEFVRVLVPGGLLFASTNGGAHLLEIRELIEEVTDAEKGWSYIRAFGLETGPEAVARHFDNVEVERYEDALEVTAAEPVIDYVRSMSSFWRVGTEEVLDEMRRRVQATIDRDGAFHISKDAGMITAMKRGGA